jgi:molybdate transport system regulatory protein
MMLTTGRRRGFRRDNQTRAQYIAPIRELASCRNMRHAPRKTTRRAAALSGEARRSVLTIRIDFGAFGYLGPGKIALMELISKHGSISAAGKEMGMSYRRAWLLVDEMNHIFRAPLVETQMGGSGGGGARLTQLGRDVVGRYRAIEGAAATASAADMRALKAALPERPSGHKPGGEE